MFGLCVLFIQKKTFHLKLILIDKLITASAVTSMAML